MKISLKICFYKIKENIHYFLILIKRVHLENNFQELLKETQKQEKNMSGGLKLSQSLILSNNDQDTVYLKQIQELVYKNEKIIKE